MCTRATARRTSSGETTACSRCRCTGLATFRSARSPATSMSSCPMAARTLTIQALEQALDTLEQRFAPQLIFYLAGADPHEGDRLGRLAVTHDGLEARDRRVFDWAWQRRIPLVFAMAGGYGRNLDDTVLAQLNTWRVAWQYHQRWQNVRP